MVECIELAPTGSLIGRYNGRAATWLKHAKIFLRARSTLPSMNHDVAHILDGSYGYILSSISGPAKVATIHDLIPHLQADCAFGPTKQSFVSKKLLNYVATSWRQLDAIAAVSLNTRNDFLDTTGISADRLNVVPNAIDPKIHEPTHLPARNELQAAQPDPVPTILHVGNNAFYKNRAAVLRIFSKVRKSAEARLVMAGSPPTKSLMRLAEQLGLKQNLTFLTNPEDDILAMAYVRASLLLFPSIYEGFGWPPLEAMSFGCPIVCSSQGSLLEVVGNAALVAPAESESELAEHCLSVLKDPQLAGRLSNEGRTRSGRFTLERMGQQLLSVYKQAMANSRAANIATLTD